MLSTPVYFKSVDILQTKTLLTMPINAFQHKNIIQNILWLRFWGEGEEGTKNMFRMTIFTRKVQVLESELQGCSAIGSGAYFYDCSFKSSKKKKKKRERLAAFSICLLFQLLVWTQTVFCLGVKPCALNPPSFFSPSQDFTIAELPCSLNMAKSCSSQESKVITLAVSLQCFSLGVS